LELKKRLSIRNTAQKEKNFISQNAPAMKRLFIVFLKAMQKRVTRKRIIESVNMGTITQDWESEIRTIIRQFIKMEFEPELQKGINKSGSAMMKQINGKTKKMFSFLYETKQAGFSSVTDRIAKFIDKQSLYFINDMSDKMITNIRESMNYMVLNDFSLSNIQDMLYNTIPLTVKQGKTLLKIQESMIAEGIKPARTKKWVAKQSDRMLKYRSELIARTEIKRAYGFGQLESINQALDNDIIKEPKKTRQVTMDDRTQHGEWQGETANIDEPYPESGEMFAGESSFNCRCVDIYTFET